MAEGDGTVQHPAAVVARAAPSEKYRVLVQKRLKPGVRDEKSSAQLTRRHGAAWQGESMAGHRRRTGAGAVRAPVQRTR